MRLVNMGIFAFKLNIGVKALKENLCYQSLAIGR